MKVWRFRLPSYRAGGPATDVAKQRPALLNGLPAPNVSATLDTDETTTERIEAPAATLSRGIDLRSIESGGRRALDIVLGLVGSIAALPVLAIAGLAILVDDGWPVIYRRQVLGVGGLEFAALKLRTMRVNEDRLLERQPELLERYRLQTKLENDPRVTRIGRALRRFHIDELPQLINVLAGQMSIVGPRMIHPSELSRFGDFGRERLSVRPGMTGLWQIAKSTYGYDERLALDRLYLRNRSLSFDLRIMLLTIPSIFGWRAKISHGL